MVSFQQNIQSHIQLFCVLTVLLLAPSTGLSQASVTPQELRGVWITNVDSDVLFTKQKIEEAMDYLADRGFNVIFPVVWNKGYTLHPSEVAREAIGVEQDPYFQGQGRDPLQEIIVEAHRRGMEVIPWFEYGFASVYGDGTGGHILRKNPHWAARNANGGIAQSNNFYWMNGFHHEVQQFMMDLIQEVIEKYDVDGIQGDDRLPAMPVQAGYSDYTRALYASEHNGASVPDQRNSAFIQWRADKLTNFAGRLYRMVKETDPNLIVSMSPSIYRWSLDNYLQDWPNWMDSSYVDIVHPQAYRYSLGDYQALIKSMFGQFPQSPNGYLYADSKPMVFPGIVIKAGSSFNGPAYVLDAIEFNRDYGLNGEVFFFYEGLDEKNNYLGDSLYAKPYKERALLPYRNGHLYRPSATLVHETDPLADKSGSWTTDETVAGYYDQAMYTAGKSGASIEYTFSVPREAWYRLYTWIPSGKRTTTGAHYQITDQEGSRGVVLNHQNFANRGWVELGEIYLAQGEQSIVRIDADSASDDRNIYVDAMMIMVDRKRSPDVEFDIVFSSTQPEAEVASEISLLPNYPNPFNPTTTVPFRLDQAQQVSLYVYDIMGRRVATLIQDRGYSKGEHRLEFDASSLSSGAYFVTLVTQDARYTQPMLLVK